MMVRLNEYEVASEYQQLDDAAVADGGFAHAHTLRAVARSSNRLITQGEPLLALSPFARAPQTTEDLEHAIRAPVVTRWSHLMRGAWVRPKKPGLTKADVFVHAEITNGAVVDIAVHTLRAPDVLRAHEGDANLLRLVGTGAKKVYKFRGIDIAPGGRERFAFSVRGNVGSASYVEEPNPTNYQASGSPRGQLVSVHPATGRVQSATNLGWNTPPSLTWSPTHAMLIHDGLILDALNTVNIVHVGQFYQIESGQVGYIWPAPSSLQGAHNIPTHNYAIVKLPTIRITHLSIWAQDRVL
jgi:hypothetical protein